MLMHSQANKCCSVVSKKDVWIVAREGSMSELDATLLSLKKNGGNINARNIFGLTPLHIATWRNHVPVIKRLLAAGADPNERDGESGWSSLHRALHFGHLAVASTLLKAGASLTLEDSRGRTPVDLLSGLILPANKEWHDSEVFSWGSGTNYQLGTGNAYIQKLPGKVDALQGSHVHIVAAAKFHSVAVGFNGELYSWGYGRGGRLGFSDFDIHSGQAAVITPRRITCGLLSHRVNAIAAAKHHTIIVVEGGDVFTWGSNREGQLGYTSVDNQPTPRRVSSMRAKIVSVTAANKHSGAVSELGEVFTWGCNKLGQLGYGTSNSASNYTPRVVEYLKGKFFVKISAAKRHTVVLSSDGEVFTWGHRLVNPRRVVIARNIKKDGSVSLKFHHMERLHAVSIAAGMCHSTALTDNGCLFFWFSSDPDLKCQQLYSLAGRNVVDISAGKYWTALVTAAGDVFMWDGKKYKDEIPIPVRLHGVKRATSVSVGETHLLVTSALYHPTYPTRLSENVNNQLVEEELEERDEDALLNADGKLYAFENVDCCERQAPSLKSLCVNVAAECLVEPRNALQLLEIADSLEALDLRKYCEDIVMHNLDYIFAISSSVVSASPDILAKLEKSFYAKSYEPWSCRRLPTPTATFPIVLESDEESEVGKYGIYCDKGLPFGNSGGSSFVAHLQSGCSSDEANVKMVRALRKKLQQIEVLLAKESSGYILDEQQRAKVQSREMVERSLAELGVPIKELVYSEMGKDKKVDMLKKQRKKSKHRGNQVESRLQDSCACEEPGSLTEFLISGSPLQVKGGKDVNVRASRYDFEDQSSLGHVKKISLSGICTSTKSKLSDKKKGGLAMFLSGALDGTLEEVTPQPTAKSEGLAWGGVMPSKGATSFREIQKEQSASKNSNINRKLALPSKSSGGHTQMDFFPESAKSSPIDIVPNTSRGNDMPWAAHMGVSSISSLPSLREIQMQQGRLQQIISCSPKMTTAGFSDSTSTGSSCENRVKSRWFRPEVETPSSIRSIQIEEKAMKDLKQFYSSVHLVKTRPPVS